MTVALFGCNRDDKWNLLPPGGVEGIVGPEATPMIVGQGHVVEDADTGSSVNEADECIPTPEICDGIDNDCDRQIDEEPTDAPDWYRDADGDAYGDPNDVRNDRCHQPAGYVRDDTDCNDAAAAINPGATEVCNGIDDDCDGEIDEGTLDVFYVDADGDGQGDEDSPEVLACSQPLGHSTNNLDCDDANSAIYDGAPEVCNGVDDDCDGTVDDGLTFLDYYVDADQDAYGAGPAINACLQPAGTVTDSTDCDDTNAAINPAATEVCNGSDDDCNGLVDDGLVFVDYYPDADGDGYGDASASPDNACLQPADTVTDNTDCVDDNAAINPGATEVCNGIDDDCDGLIDGADDSYTGDMGTWYADVDGDGFGDDDTAVTQCSAPDGYISAPGDCDDADAAINPAADEICDGIDNDCDGLVDDADPSVTDQETWYADNDGDLWGAGPGVLICPNGDTDGYVQQILDCDDTNAAINPDADEICNEIDDDCDGLIDDADPSYIGDANQPWYADADGDLYGNPNNMIETCAPPPGYVSDDTDCNDGNAAVNPGATEVCNGIDDDCDSLVDEGLLTTSYADTDGDGYGDPNAPANECTIADGHVTDNTDCDDDAAAVNPGATEICNGIDDDCDGLIDEPDAVGAQDWYADVDGDSYGDPDVGVTACNQPDGYVSDDTDCDDAAAPVNPGATEVCNGIDDDCDGEVDEGVMGTWYADADGDGFGDASQGTDACDAPQGYVSDDNDCDDADAWTHPGAIEWCDGKRNDCDDAGWTDDDGLVSYFKDDGTRSDLTGDFTSGSVWNPADRTYSDDGTIQVCAGTYYVSLNLDADIEVFGFDGPSEVRLHGASKDTIIAVRQAGHAVAVTDLELYDGEAEYTLPRNATKFGGAIHCVGNGASLTISGVQFTINHSTGWGGGIGADRCDVTITDTDFDRDCADHAGGDLAIERADANLSGIYSTGGEAYNSEGGGSLFIGGGATLVVDDGEFANGDGRQGGAIYTKTSTGSTAPSVTITNSTFDTNHASYRGGAIKVDAGSLSIDGSTFTGNSSVQQAGAVYVLGHDTTAEITDTTFDMNESTAAHGGAIKITYADVDISDCTFTDNEADNDGGAVMVWDATCDISDSTFTGNHSDREGGGVAWYPGASGTITSVDFDDNSANQGGGGLYVESATVDVVTSTFTSNTTNDVKTGNNSTYNYSGSTTVTCTNSSCN